MTVEKKLACIVCKTEIEAPTLRWIDPMKREKGRRTPLLLCSNIECAHKYNAYLAGSRLGRWVETHLHSCGQAESLEAKAAMAGGSSLSIPIAFNQAGETGARIPSLMRTAWYLKTSPQDSSIGQDRSGSVRKRDLLVDDVDSEDSATKQGAQR